MYYYIGRLAVWIVNAPVWRPFRLVCETAIGMCVSQVILALLEGICVCRYSLRILVLSLAVVKHWGSDVLANCVYHEKSMDYGYDC